MHILNSPYKFLIMKSNIILLTWNLIGVWLPGSMPKKENMCVDPTEDDRIQLEYETEHHTEFKMKVDTYYTWPELDRLKTMEICQKYLRKLYPRKNLNVAIHRFVSVKLYYKMNLHYRKTFDVGALECRFAQQNDVLRAYYFTRAPEPGCMYLLNRLKSSKSFFISLKICHLHTHSSLRKTGGLKRALSRTRKNLNRSYKDSNENQAEHEMNHSRYLQDNKCVYRKYPQLEKRDNQECCPILLNKLFPQTNLKIIRSSFQIITLVYIRIRKHNGIEYKPTKVPALICTLPTKSTNRNYLFVTAPKYNCWSCVFYVTKTCKSFHHYHITKLLCDDKEDKDEQDKLF